jgi:uncharacterized protein (TIGR02246 family)
VSDLARTPRRVLLAAAAFAAFGSVHSAHGQPSGGDPAQIVAVMDRYVAALRSNNVEALVALYASDGIFMRENLPAVVGAEALRAAYRQIFATLKVDLSFDIQEIEVAGDMAWLRGISKGRIKTLATGVETNESFNQLIVLRRQAGGPAGAWKIRSYLYASNQPGAGTPQ